MLEQIKQRLARIHALNTGSTLRIMNVCGGHERAIAQAGLRSLLPSNLRLIPGPGCPVCVCPEADLYQLTQWALQEPLTVVSFGDMLRVPIHAPRGEVASLEQARASGADVRPIASPRDAVRIAREQAPRPVIFHAIGFETTLAPIAALICEGLPDNLFILLSGRRTWPAVALLLESADAGLDALIAPGHVATVMGLQEWAFVPEQHGVATAVAGFTADSLLAAIESLLEQSASGQAQCVNCYPLAVKAGGNQVAQRCLAECFSIVDADWRGIGIIPQSGYALREPYQVHDARRYFPPAPIRANIQAMPAGCACAEVVLGKIEPNQCRLYASACTPRHPIGPCMVSDEGACRIWWASGIRTPQPRSTKNT